MVIFIFYFTIKLASKLHATTSSTLDELNELNELDEFNGFIYETIVVIVLIYVKPFCMLIFFFYYL